MTKKPVNPVVHPPPATSSDDDEVETSFGEEEEVSSSEEDEPIPPSAAVTTAVPAKPTVSATGTKQASESESGSGTETESDSEPEEASKNPNAGGSGKAIVTAVATNPKKKEGVSSSAAALALPLPAVVKSGTKRPGEGTSRDGGNAKRAKKDTSGEDDEKKKKKQTGEDTKKAAFQKLWTDDDEVALLQGMIRFKNETGKSPYADSNGFYEFTKKSISFKVSKNQCIDKLRSLKRKYMLRGKNGKEQAFTRPHDVKALALSKSIWGSEGMALQSAKSNGTSKKSQSKMKMKLESVKQDLFASQSSGKNDEKDRELMLPHDTSDWFDESFLVQSIASYGVSERSVKQEYRSLSSRVKKKMEEMMNVLRASEVEFLLYKTEIWFEIASLIREARLGL